MDRSFVSDTWKASALYAALTLLFAYPLSLHPGETLFGDNPDTHLFIWTLAWDTHAFVHQPLAIFDANIYYPNGLTLAYSENLIGSALVAAPILWLTGNPVLAMNIPALLACVLCGLGAYVLARSLRLDGRGAIICGLVFAFAPARFVRTGQLHLGTVQWIPFALASLHAYFDGGRARDLRLAVAFFMLQALTSGHGAVFLTLAMSGLVAYRVLFGEPLALRQRLRDFGLQGALLLAPAALVYWPYRRVQIEMGLRRTLGAWAPTPESFLAAPTHLQHWLLSWLPGPHVNETASAHLFPGYLPVLLAGIALLARAQTRGRRRLSLPGCGVIAPRWQSRAALVLDIVVIAGMTIGLVVLASGPIRWRVGGVVLFSVRDVVRPLILVAVAVALRIALARTIPFAVRERLHRLRESWRQQTPGWRRDTTTFYGLLTLMCVWISLGPPIGIWPLIYWIPGLNFIRVPTRFMVLAMLGLAVLAGIGFDRLAARLSSWKRTWLAAAVGVLLVVEFAGMPLPVTPYRVNIPAVDRWLATQPKPFVVAEFPVTLAIRYQTTYMLHSMVHWQKTVHGYSGFEAPLHTRLYQELRGFPDELSLRRLRDLGVYYMVVHEDFYPPGAWPAVDDRLQRFKDQLTLEHTEGSGRVYSFRREP